MAAHFVGEAPLFALADGTIHRWGARAPMRVHSALLAATPTADCRALITSGEDGRVCWTGDSDESLEFAALPRKWIMYVASSLRGAVAFAVGRSVWLHEGPSALRELQHARTVGGLAFSPDGERIAVARYGGVSIHAVYPGAEGVELEWQGIYDGIAFSPDGRFLVAFMQEALMHGWRLGDGQHFRMTGYPGRIRDWSWSAGGRWLATSGAPSAILWPFEGYEGPIGAAALELGAPRGDALVSAVACHPARAEVAIGYVDGALSVAGIDDGAVCMLRPSGHGSVSAIAWHNSGSRIAFGTESGECGVLEVRR